VIGGFTGTSEGQRAERWMRNQMFGNTGDMADPQDDWGWVDIALDSNRGEGPQWYTREDRFFYSDDIYGVDVAAYYDLTWAEIVAYNGGSVKRNTWIRIPGIPRNIRCSLSWSSWRVVCSRRADPMLTVFYLRRSWPTATCWSGETIRVRAERTRLAICARMGRGNLPVSRYACRPASRAFPGRSGPIRSPRSVLRAVVDHLVDRGGEDGLWEPALQLLQIFLVQDALARGLRYGNAANAEHGEHGIRLRFGTRLRARFRAPLFPAFVHGHDELLLFGGTRRLLSERVLQLYQDLFGHGTLVCGRGKCARRTRRGVAASACAVCCALALCGTAVARTRCAWPGTRETPRRWARGRRSR
jgi:hypothetical protein